MWVLRSVSSWLCKSIYHELFCPSILTKLTTWGQNLHRFMIDGMVIKHESKHSNFDDHDTYLFDIIFRFVTCQLNMSAKPWKKSSFNWGTQYYWPMPNEHISPRFPWNKGMSLSQLHFGGPGRYNLTQKPMDSLGPVSRNRGLKLQKIIICSSFFGGVCCWGSII